MSFRIPLLFLLSLVLFACRPQPQHMDPAYVLPEEKMVSIMVDMHLVETAANLKVFPPDSAQQVYYDQFESIYLTNGVTKGSYDSSLYYYATQTDQMNVIYDKVLENISELESRVNSNR